MAAERGYIRPAAMLLAAALIYTGLGCPAAAEEGRIEAFFGAYVGTARLEGAAAVERDIIVSIEPARKGFSIYTSTVIGGGPDRASPGVRWRAETQQFVATDMAHLYEPLPVAAVHWPKPLPLGADGRHVFPPLDGS